MIYFGNKISPAFISWRWIKGCWSRVGNTVLPSLWNATARRLWTCVPLEWDRPRDMDAPQFLRGLCGEGDVCLARGVTQRGTLALDYKWRTRLLPDPHECGVLLRSCLCPTQWPRILGALWAAGQFLLMHMFAVGKKAVMAVGWEYVWFGADGGKPKEQTGSELHVECAWLDRLEEGACFGYTPLFWRCTGCAHKCSRKCIPSREVCAAAGLCPCASSACGAS